MRHLRPRAASTAVLAGCVLACGPAPSAHAKSDVSATLVRPLDLASAEAGERVRITWTLRSADGRPFGAGEVFARLRSARGGRHVTAFTDGTGRFSVRMRVPRGGVGRVEFGLKGMRIVAGKASRADIIFPLTNDPFD